MAKDPAFLFYDGDAARDVSHLNRLERGCYFDLIQAQRKFGRLSIEIIKRVLGKDFETCWSQLEICLTYDSHMYFIEWLELSTIKRKAYSESRSKNRKSYKSTDSGLTYDNHMENENENKIVLKEVGSEKVKGIANEAWADQAWREQMCMGLSLSMEQLKKWLAQFNSSVASDAVAGFNKGSYKKMSRGWILSQQAKGTTIETGVQKSSTAPSLTRI